MESITVLFDNLIALLPGDSPGLRAAYKVFIAVAGCLLIWIILRWLLYFVERRFKQSEFIQSNHRVFQIIRRVLFLALLLVVGTYLLRITQIPILEKIFHALLIIAMAFPVKNFLVIAIRFLQHQ